MSEKLNEMKDAIMGQGGGLQSTSTAAGEVLAGSSDMRSGSSKKSDDASKSLGDFAKGGATGQTAEGTSVKASDQVANMQTGSADHLELGMRKET